MKKIVIISLIGFLPALLSAQDLALNKIAVPGSSDNSITAADPATTTVKTAKTARREARATKQFDRTSKLFNHDFKDATHVIWTSQKDGFVASFTTADARNVAWYAKDGSLLYSMRTYSADKLPDAEQKIIQNAYSGYKMKFVNEVHQNDVVVYVVSLENDRAIKLVTVCNGATSLYRSYKRM